MDSIINVLSGGMVQAVLFVFAGLLLFALYRSSTMRKQGKRGLTIFLIAAGMSVGYYFITGESPVDILGKIDNFFNGPQAAEETSHKYYNDPEKRYKDYLE